MLGGPTTCALGYLLAERIGRPVTERALAGSVPDEPALPGVAARLLLAWGLSTGVPVLGLALVGGGEVVGISEASSDRLAATTCSSARPRSSSGSPAWCSRRARSPIRSSACATASPRSARGGPT